MLQTFGWSQPWVLFGLPLLLLPMLIKGYQAFDYPSIQCLPDDVWSRWLARSWRGFGVLAIASLLVGLAGPYAKDKSIQLLGKGAHVMVVLDRSASMNDDFAGQRNGAEISKMAAAREVLERFISNSQQDLIGMVTFNTSPIRVAPLSGDRVATMAALHATEAGGVGFTAIAKGIGLALDTYEDKPVTGSRVILLVSDGGAHLDGKTRNILRESFHRQSASLYWIYLRDTNGGSLQQQPEEGNEDAYPEYQLHTYFQSLGIPYKAYEAEDPQAVARALEDVARLKNLPVTYQTSEPRRDLSGYCYFLGLLSLLGLFLLHITEVRAWRVV